MYVFPSFNLNVSNKQNELDIYYLHKFSSFHRIDDKWHPLISGKSETQLPNQTSLNPGVVPILLRSAFPSLPLRGKEQAQLHREAGPPHTVSQATDANNKAEGTIAGGLHPPPPRDTASGPGDTLSPSQHPQEIPAQPGQGPCVPFSDLSLYP